MHTLFKKNGEKHRCFVLQMQIVDPYSSEVESVVKRRVGCPSLESNLFVWHIDTSQTFLSQPKVKTVHLKSELFVTYTILEEKVNMNVNKAKCRRGVVVITTAQPHSTKPELSFCAGSNPARGVSEIRDGEDRWQWSRLEIRLNAFRWSTIPQKQFIIIIIIVVIIMFGTVFWKKSCQKGLLEVFIEVLFHDI